MRQGKLKELISLSSGRKGREMDSQREPSGEMTFGSGGPGRFSMQGQDEKGGIQKNGTEQGRKGWQGCAMWAGESVLVPGRVGAVGEKEEPWESTAWRAYDSLESTDNGSRMATVTLKSRIQRPTEFTK